jgi:hypothetical protein
MATLAAPKVQLKLVPVLKTTLYAGLAGELFSNAGMKDSTQLTCVMQAVSEGLVQAVIVKGCYPDGRWELIKLNMKDFKATDSVMLAPEPGKSLLETVDVSLAAAVQKATDTIKRLSLRPEFYVDWSARAKANPAIIADAIRRLNLKAYKEPEPEPPVLYDLPYTDPSPSTTPATRYPQTVHTYMAPPAPPAGYKAVTVMRIEPAKDPGLSLDWTTTRRI